MVQVDVTMKTMLAEDYNSSPPRVSVYFHMPDGCAKQACLERDI